MNSANRIAHIPVRPNPRRQAGFSLMEAVVAMSISLVVTASMVALMANSLGATARIVNMTKLSDDLRSTMQMLTRDVRRASYNANAVLCYGNEDCATDGSGVTLAGDLVINNSQDCFTFQLDRGHNGNSIDDDAGGFRRVVADDVGELEMWTGASPPDVGDCQASLEALEAEVKRLSGARGGRPAARRGADARRLARRRAHGHRRRGKVRPPSCRASRPPRPPRRRSRRCR